MGQRHATQHLALSLGLPLRVDFVVLSWNIRFRALAAPSWSLFLVAAFAVKAK